MGKSTRAISIGDSMKDIEAKISILEDQGLPIEAAMEAYEQGVTLIRAAQEQLLELEQKVTVLAAKDAEKE